MGGGGQGRAGRRALQGRIPGCGIPHFMKGTTQRVRLLHASAKVNPGYSASDFLKW